MLPVSDIPMHVDGDGYPHLFTEVDHRYVVSFRPFCRDDTQTTDELKAAVVALGWGGEPCWYEQANGFLEALFYTDQPLPQDTYTVGDVGRLDTRVYAKLAPGAEVNGNKNYVRISRKEISPLPKAGLDLVAAEETKRAEREAARNAAFGNALKGWNEILNAKAAVKCDAPWPWLAEMNERYRVTQHGGRTMVHEQVHDPELGQVVHRWTTFPDLVNRHLHERVTVPDPSNPARNVTVDKGTAWLNSNYRRQYDAEVFLPGQETAPNILNLWQGFSIEPRMGRWARFRRHLLDVICDGNQANFNYLIRWIARMVQFPGQIGAVAVVLQGGEGTGKGIVCRMLLHLLGAHGIQISQTRHLTGNFNAHLANKVLVFADEAFFGGDPRVRGPLFALITEPHLEIEGKGVDTRTVANYTHLLACTNEELAIPAGVNSRRFFVLRVSERRRQDTQYFGAIDAEMKAGGLAAMLHDLLEMDLSDFNVFDVPQTEALAQQKVMSLKGPERWLFDCLHRGQVAGERWAAAGFELSKDNAYEAYERASKAAQEYTARDRSTWSRLCRAAIGSNWGEKRPGGVDRSRVLVLGPLADARAGFEKHLGHKIEWDTDATPINSEGGPADAAAVFNY